MCNFLLVNSSSEHLISPAFTNRMPEMMASAELGDTSHWCVSCEAQIGSGYETKYKLSMRKKAHKGLLTQDTKKILNHLFLVYLLQ